MEEEKKKAYSEVVEILKLIDDEEKLEKLPLEFIEVLKLNSDPAYKPEIAKEIPLEEQNLRDETYAILGWIASKYWDENFIVTNENNSQVSTEEKMISVFNDIEEETLEGKWVIETGNLPALIHKEKWYLKVKEQLIQFFKTLFKLNKKNEKQGVIE